MARFTTQRRKRQPSPSRQRANYLARQERDFLAQLISLRKEAGLTQQDVAEKLGVSQQAISKFESLDSSPTLSTAMSYAHAVQALVHFEAILDNGRFEAFGENWISTTIQEAPPIPGEAPEPSESTLDVTPEHFISTQGAEAFVGALQSDLALAARKQSPTDSFTGTQKQWIHNVAQKATCRIDGLPQYDASKLRVVANRIPSLTVNPEGFAALSELLAGAGVCLVYSELLPGAKMSGVSFQIENTPIIGISGSGKRLDKVLFTLMHEIAHVLNGDISLEAAPILHGDKTSAGKIEQREDAANKLAEELIFAGNTVPIPPNPRRASYKWAYQQAEELGVNYIVLVGRLQNDDVLTWRQLSKDAPQVIDYLERWE
ncbi:MAG TPA: helix-turn-helix domain-containing protein [Candidatus Rothia avicola]|uniref:Helix-turn-helix domain-containing protein n=1 Tax=Candidatus Rothia avicola TaxID=2840478 RepID=A0A9D1ZQJ8_9MICC|nr:helix-turn-helix domain-containing protein [Candidatus Rothia avicola]